MPIPIAIFLIQFKQIIKKIIILDLRFQSLFKEGKNVSFPFIISFVIHIAEIKINRLVRIARGLINIDSCKSPLINFKVARVEPQAGQGMPVINLKIQNV